MAKIGGLGRGLDALMGESSGESGGFLEKKGNFVKKWLNKANQIIVLNGFLENIFREYEIPCQVIPIILECKENVRRF